ncbi:MAG: F0F1 ATP synthase subunit epsilon [Bacteroidales bacterium]|nr:F0F1 ATP synthase subunit epsilon [Bacteroidales bacterium]
MTIRILTPEGTLFEGTAGAVFLPGALSPFEVLPDHAPIISALSAGEIRVVGPGEQRFAVRGGMVRVRHNEIIACVETR